MFLIRVNREFDGKQKYEISKAEFNSRMSLLYGEPVSLQNVFGSKKEENET